MNNYYIYFYLRQFNSKHGSANSPYYIGKGIGRRAWSKTHRVRPPKNTAYIKIVQKDLNEAEAYQEEIRLIKLYGRIDLGNGCLQNRTDGGDSPPHYLKGDLHHPMLGKKHSPESKEKMRLAKLGKKTGPHDKQWNENISQGNKGLKRNPETCINIGKSKKGFVNSKLYTPEWCEKVSKAKMGIKRPDMLSGSDLQNKSAKTRTGKKRGRYKI
jgi:hypothetical protein